MKSQHKKDEAKRFSENTRLIYATIALAVIVLILTGLFFRIYSNQPNPPKAAIIDQLSSSQLSEISRYENQTFIQTTDTLLQKRFSKIDYYKENATVEQYKWLATENYKVIIWRVHSALDNASKFIAISTSQKYGSTNYDQYLDDGHLTLCNIVGDPNLYFGITPKFIKEIMVGRFEDTVIILMSCNGLREEYNATAEAFIEKGAKVVLSWDGWIDAPGNDFAIALLLDYLVNGNNSIGEAVNKIPEQFNPDYGPSKLRYYPANSEVASYTIPNYKQSILESTLCFTIPVQTKLRAK